jgi:phosphoglycerate dehydrogenase-like enzyme
MTGATTRADRRVPKVHVLLGTERFSSQHELDAETIHAAHVGLIQQFGAGVENIDIAAATAAGAWVANVPGLNAVDVAEHAVLLLLALLRRLPESPSGFDPGHWGDPPGEALAGSTVCIVGLG